MDYFAAVSLQRLKSCKEFLTVRPAPQCGTAALLS